MASLAEALREAGGQVDATGQLLKGLALQPVAGLGGAGRTMIDLLRGQGVEKSLASGAKTVEDIEGWGPGPFTERGAQRLNELGGMVEGATDWAGEKLGNPLEKLGEVSPMSAAAVTALLETPPGPGKGARAASTAKRVIAKAKKAEEATPGATLRADIQNAIDPKIIDPTLGAELANRYPRPGPSETKLKANKVDTYEAKKQTPEESALWSARKKAQAEIDKGNYTPHYPVEERFHTDPAQFPRPVTTQEAAQPAKQATRDQYAAQWDTPEVADRLNAAYDRGSLDPAADRWYGMGQLVSDFNAELGPEAGGAAFRSNFSDPMGATTARATPEANLMQAAYGNYLRTNDLPLPEASHQVPTPATGPDTMGNQRLYQKVITQGEGLSPADQPKRHNFASNFEGHTGPMTIDSRMMSGVDPTGTHQAPPGMTYGTIEGAAQRIARERGDTGADAQAKMWVGLGDEPTKPMIQTVNEAIERTRRITGKDPKDIVRDSLIRGTHPLYQAAGLGVGTAGLVEALREREEPMQ